MLNTTLRSQCHLWRKSSCFQIKILTNGKTKRHGQYNSSLLLLRGEASPSNVKQVKSPPKLDNSFPTIYRVIKRHEKKQNPSSSESPSPIINDSRSMSWQDDFELSFKTKFHAMEKTLKSIPRVLARNKQEFELRQILEEMLISHYLPVKRWIYVLSELLPEEEQLFVDIQKEKLKSIEMELKKYLEFMEKYVNEVLNQKVPYMDELFEQYLEGKQIIPSFQLPNVKMSWKNDGKSESDYEMTHEIDSDLECLLRDEFIKGRINRDELMLKEPSEFLKIFENGLGIVKPHTMQSIENVLKFMPFKNSIPIWKLQKAMNFIRNLLLFPHTNIEQYGKFSMEKALQDFISMTKGNFVFKIYTESQEPFIRIQCHELDKKSKSFGNIYIVQGKSKGTDNEFCKTFTIKEGRKPAMVTIMYGDTKKLNALQYRALIRSLAFSLHELILLNINEFSDLDALSSNFKYVIPFLFETIATDSKMGKYYFLNMAGINTIYVSKYFNKKFTRPLETREELIKNILLLKLFLVHYKTEVDPVQFFNDGFVQYLKEIPKLEISEIEKNVNYTSLLSKKDIERPHETFNVLLSKILAGQLFEMYNISEPSKKKEIILGLLNHSPNRSGQWSIDDLLKLTNSKHLNPDYFASKRFRATSRECYAPVITMTLKLILIALLCLLAMDIYKTY